MTDPKAARALAARLVAVGDFTRLQIVAEIAAHGPVTVGVVAERLGVPMVNMSQHLKMLRQAGILADQKLGRHVEYRFAPGVFIPPATADELGTLHFGAWRISIGRKKGK
ncbi:ArsR/SmtB family transcription factor [Limnoglobus roseus]|uniref:ArsR family transcriptional regulator n=1 Tax=Limnoglobus roseus TaxID=2598579 RepID=A0A5C1AFR7_9BACT|nr:metalloregulator ArsR/SmtB family transcription factor [Limnoglobus roseus]QEL17435.1 ArsR family transcriptional regulator [Limnoglobus roseus]